MFPRTLFSEEHVIFRGSVAKFMEKEVVRYHDQWEKDGQVSRKVWLKAGEAGMRNRLQSSPLCDGVGFAHDLESTFRDVWQNWYQQHQPHSQSS